MKVAANVIAVAGWLGFLAALWWPLVSGVMPPVGRGLRRRWCRCWWG